MKTIDLLFSPHIVSTDRRTDGRQRSDPLVSPLLTAGDTKIILLEANRLKARSGPS